MPPSADPPNHPNRYPRCFQKMSTALTLHGRPRRDLLPIQTCIRPGLVGIEGYSRSTAKSHSSSTPLKRPSPPIIHLIIMPYLHHSLAGSRFSTDRNFRICFCPLVPTIQPTLNKCSGSLTAACLGTILPSGQQRFPPHPL